jgi:hypothetical protein
MTTEPENNADALVTHIEECIDMKGRPNAPKLEEMRALAVDLYFQIERLQTRNAYQERDSRETFKTINMLKESGLIDDEHWSVANGLVVDARSPTNRYTDLETIKKRNIEDDKKEQAI